MEKDFSELECVLNELKNMYIIIGAFCKNEEELKKCFSNEELSKSKKVILDLTEQYSEELFNVSEILLFR